MSKQVTFKRPAKPAAEEWINAEPRQKHERSKRLTIDVSAELHRRIKLTCAQRGDLISEVVRRLLEDAFREGRGAKK